MQTAIIGYNSASISWSLRVLVLLAVTVPALCAAQSATPGCPLDSATASCPQAGGSGTTARHSLDTWQQENHAQAVAARRQFAAQNTVQREYSAQELATAMDNRQQWEQTMEQVRRQHALDLQNSRRMQEEYRGQQQAADAVRQQALIRQQ